MLEKLLPRCASVVQSFKKCTENTHYFICENSIDNSRNNYDFRLSIRQALTVGLIGKNALRDG
jgi:hypothetical protein